MPVSSHLLAGNVPWPVMAPWPVTSFGPRRPLARMSRRSPHPYVSFQLKSIPAEEWSAKTFEAFPMGALWIFRLGDFSVAIYRQD
jgi:hypothetical protein